MRIALLLLLLCGMARADDGSGSGDVRPLLRSFCPDCHERSSAKSVPKALAVFDLDDPALTFTARMTPAQLDKINGRMAGTKAGAEERARVADFVRAEKGRRAAR